MQFAYKRGDIKKTEVQKYQFKNKNNVISLVLFSSVLRIAKVIKYAGKNKIKLLFASIHIDSWKDGVLVIRDCTCFRKFRVGLGHCS